MNAVDWFVLLGTMIGIAAYGTWRTRHTDNLNTYLKGSRTTKWGTIGLSVMGAVMAQRLAAKLPMAEALHGAFVVGAAVCVAALLSAFLVPGGRAQDLARREMQGEPTRAGG